eukprot:1309207-Prymnesium_polylepis.1
MWVGWMGCGRLVVCGVVGGLSLGSSGYRAWPVAASSLCKDQPTLVQLGLVWAHDHSDLANGCSEVTY